MAGDYCTMTVGPFEKCNFFLPSFRPGITLPLPAPDKCIGLTEFLSSNLFYSCNNIKYFALYILFLSLIRASAAAHRWRWWCPRRAVNGGSWGGRLWRAWPGCPPSPSTLSTAPPCTAWTLLQPETEPEIWPHLMDRTWCQGRPPTPLRTQNHSPNDQPCF